MVALLRSSKEPWPYANNLEFIGTTTLSAPRKFNKKSADKITDFDPTKDTLNIDTDSFEIDQSASFKAAKNSKELKSCEEILIFFTTRKKVVSISTRMVSKGFGDGGIIAILKGLQNSRPATWSSSRHPAASADRPHQLDRQSLEAKTCKSKHAKFKIKLIDNTMPFSQNSVKAKVITSNNTSGEERLKIELSGNLLPDTNVDWYYLMFKLSIEDDTRSYSSTIFHANTYPTGGAVPIINYQQGYFNKSKFFDYLDYLPSSDKQVDIVLDAVAYKGKSWYKISSDDPSGNSISELEALGISHQQINNQLSKSIEKLGFVPQTVSTNSSEYESNATSYKLTQPSEISKKSAKRIDGFSNLSDTLKIDVQSFSISRDAKFATGKNKKVVTRQLAKQDIDFLYDQKKGVLYFNENGAKKGFGDGGTIAILKGAPELSSNNIDFTYSENKKQKKITIKKPKTFSKKSADKITNFNLSSDTLNIDTESFDIDRSASFKAAKNSKEVKKFARKTFDFLYDQKKGGLYFNENGSNKGFGEGGIMAILKGAPDLTESHFEWI